MSLQTEDKQPLPPKTTPVDLPTRQLRKQDSNPEAAALTPRTMARLGPRIAVCAKRMTAFRPHRRP